MIKFRYLLVFLLTAFTISSCEDYIGGDTNVSPNFVGADAITLEALLSTTIFHTSNNHYLVGITTSRIPQQTAHYVEEGFDSHFPTTMSTAWTGIYLSALTNLFELEKLARAENANHYLGITQILQAMNIGLATDIWEDVPYSQAFLGEEDFTPVYDSQQSLYTEMNGLLDNAIVNLSVVNGSVFIPAEDDLVFGGSTDKWIRAAHALKARYALHLSGQNATTAASTALAELANAMVDNGDDLQLNYNSVNLNPYHTAVALANNTGNATIMLSEQLVESMDGTIFGVFDPRLPVMADNGIEGDNTTFVGGLNGAGGISSSGASVNADFGVNSYYSSASSPIFMITYAEQKFIEAEAEFITNGGTTTSVGSSQAAYDAYIAGITAHINKLGVDGTTYLADPNVAVTPAGLTLALIMNEKMKATFLNPEAWVDLRRYNSDPNVFTNLTLPDNHDPDLVGEWIQRVEFPIDEFNRNEENARAAEKENDARMWRDQ